MYLGLLKGVLLALSAWDRDLDDLAYAPLRALYCATQISFLKPVLAQTNCLDPFLRVPGHCPKVVFTLLQLITRMMQQATKGDTSGHALDSGMLGPCFAQILETHGKHQVRGTDALGKLRTQPLCRFPAICKQQRWGWTVCQPSSIRCTNVRTHDRILPLLSIERMNYFIATWTPPY